MYGVKSLDMLIYWYYQWLGCFMLCNTDTLKNGMCVSVSGTGTYTNTCDYLNLFIFQIIIYIIVYVFVSCLECPCFIDFMYVSLTLLAFVVMEMLGG